MYIVYSEKKDGILVSSPIAVIKHPEVWGGRGGEILKGLPTLSEEEEKRVEGRNVDRVTGRGTMSGVQSE
jgi:hypothetical protein